MKDMGWMLRELTRGKNERVLLLSLSCPFLLVRIIHSLITYSQEDTLLEVVVEVKKELPHQAQKKTNKKKMK